MMPTAMPSWDDTNSIDAAFDWDGFELMHIETSDFMASAKEIEQICGSEAAMTWTGGDLSANANSKLQIRNHDCMWSGTCGDQSHPGKLGGCGRNHHGPAVVVKEEAQFNTVTAVAAASLNSQKTTILTPSNSINIGNNNNNNNNNNATTTPKINSMKAAQIPAGRSLLINPRIKQQQLQAQQQINRVPTVSTADFLRERESTMPLHHHTRPDTPLSLDDDPPEFKHNIDLATCTIGSNRLSLISSSRHQQHQQQQQQQLHHFNSHLHHHHNDDASSRRIINMLKADLEDTDSGSLRGAYMTSSSGDIGSLTDLLNDLEEIDGDREDGEDAEDSSSHGDEEELDSDTDDCSRSSKGGGGGSSISGGYTHAHHQEMSPTSSSSSSSSSSSYEYQGTHVGDHSYTLPKKRYNPTELGVQTPSDSEEEIDVVSIGEKNLPTNLTSRNKRALESRVAQKIARKQAQNGTTGGVVPGSSSSSNGSAHHHRRRHSDDDGYHHHHNGHAGSSQTTSPSKLGLSPNYLTPASSTSISGTNTPLPGNSRKRPSKDDHRGKNRGHQQHHRSKKQRPSGSPGKHHQHQQQHQQQHPHQQKGSSDSSEEQETLEKRNLHNDMERQRRIGLKNLFEELKRQIPNLREKERAPKVNILREAANLCNRLNREQEQLNALRKQQQRLYARVRQLRTSLHSQRRTMD